MRSALTNTKVVKRAMSATYGCADAPTIARVRRLGRGAGACSPVTSSERATSAQLVRASRPMQRTEQRSTSRSPPTNVKTCLMAMSRPGTPSSIARPPSVWRTSPWSIEPSTSMTAISLGVTCSDASANDVARSKSTSSIPGANRSDAPRAQPPRTRTCPSPMATFATSSAPGSRDTSGDGVATSSGAVGGDHVMVGAPLGST